MLRGTSKKKKGIKKTRESKNKKKRHTRGKNKKEGNMKKLFLTSGVLMCMACPTVADADPHGFINTSVNKTTSGGTTTYTAAPANNAANPTPPSEMTTKTVQNACVIDIIGVDTSTTTTLEAKWAKNWWTISFDERIGNAQATGGKSGTTTTPDPVYAINGDAKVYKQQNGTTTDGNPIFAAADGISYGTGTANVLVTGVPVGQNVKYTLYNNLTSATGASGQTSSIQNQTGASYTASNFTTAPATSATNTRPFLGFYKTASSTAETDQYVDATGHLTQYGSAAASGATANQTWYARYEGKKPTLTNPVLPGYTFKGWSKTGACGTETLITAPETLYVQNTALYACWAPKDQKVTLNKTSGTSDAKNVTSGTNELYTRYDVGSFLTSAKRDGYKFNPATNTADVMTTEANAIASVPVGKSVQITYNTSTNAPTNPSTNQKYSITAPGSTSKARKFIGFYNAQTSSTIGNCSTAENNGSGTQYMDATGNLTSDGIAKSKTLTSDATWYAGWEADSQSLASGPSLTGYTFAGWFTTASGTTALSGSTYSPYCDQTLYGKWTANKYSVKYNKTTHSASSAATYTHSNGATFDAAYTIPADSSTSGTPGYGVKNAKTAATGYTFVGWTTDSTPVVTRTSGVHTNTATSATLANAYTGDTYWKRTSTLNLYAGYLANEYKVTYSCGSESGTSGTAPTANYGTYDAAYTVATNGTSNCKRTGYTFKEWSCTASLGGNTTTKYASGASVTTFKATSDVTCTATWWAQQPKIAWDYNGGNVNGHTDWAANAVADGGSTECTYDSSVTLPTNPARLGYTFDGWTVQ